MSELWLGVPEEKIAPGATTAAALYDNRIGGQPVWMFQQPAAPLVACPLCGSSAHVALLSQMHAPLDCYDRILYTLVCRKCAGELTHATVAAATAAAASEGKKPNKKKDGGAAAAADSAAALRVPAQLAAVSGSKSPVFVVRCQNYNRSYDEAAAAEQQGAVQKKNEPKEATFQADDDWGDEDDGADAKAKKAQAEAAAAAAAKQKQAEAEAAAVAAAAAKKNDPAKQVLPVACAVGIAGSSSSNVAFPEHRLDIFNAEDDSDEDDDSGSDDDAAVAATGSRMSDADKARVKQQIDALKAKYPEAHFDETAFMSGVASSTSAATTKHGAATAAAAQEEEEEEQAINAMAAAAKQVEFPQWQTFVTRIGAEPRQVVRWQPGGFPVSALELGLLPGSADRKVQDATAAAVMEQAGRDSSADLRLASQAYQLLLKTQVPPCERCGAPRRFEYQLMSPLFYFLGDDDVSFATAIVFTCSKLCASSAEAPYAREFVLLQNEPVVTNTAELVKAASPVEKK